MPNMYTCDDCGASVLDSRVLKKYDDENGETTYLCPNCDNDSKNVDPEDDLDISKKLFKARMIAKSVSQISFELREIDKAFPSDYYNFNDAEKMLSFYQIVENKILELSKEINNNRMTQNVIFILAERGVE